MKLPVINGKGFANVVQKLGFIEMRQKGSHKTFKHQDGRVITIAIHSKPIPLGLLNKIVKQDLMLSRTEFIKLL